MGHPLSDYCISCHEWGCGGGDSCPDDSGRGARLRQAQEQAARLEAIAREIASLRDRIVKGDSSLFSEYDKLVIKRDFVRRDG
jgi:hypothetical protein